MNFVEFDRAKLERFKAARDAAILDGLLTFVFEGELYLVTYAKYMIEYLEAKLPP